MVSYLRRALPVAVKLAETSDLPQDVINRLAAAVCASCARTLANEVIGDEKWLQEEFIATVQQRGAAVIKARGLSSAGSASNAVVDTAFSLTNDTPGNDWHSVAVCSDGSYDVEKGLISSFPIRVRGGKWQIVQELPINDFSRAKIDASIAELKEEKSLVAELLGK